ncbi:unnamed protein product [Durusdinium trenchii]|uniref:Uncharacterized protein n=1 Tax=Durusdinium trenchii TaxID=1381693 RepID=A0ABP0IH22_9DINO
MEMANETRTSPRTAEVDPLPGRVAPSVQEMQRSLMMPQPHEHPRGDSPRTLELQRLRMQGRVSSGVSAGSQASRRPERASAFAKFASWSSNPQPAQAAETADEQKPSPRTLELQRLRGQGRVSATSAARSMQATPPQRETMDLAVETPSPRTLELQRLRGQGRVSAGSQVARSLQSPPPASAEGMTLGSPEQKPSPRTLELQQLRMQGRVSAGSHAMQRTPTEEFGASRSSGPAGMGRTRVQDLPGFSTSPGTAPSSSVQPRRSSPIRLEESSIYAEPDIDAQPSHGLAARSAEKPVPKRLGSWSSRDSCDSDLGLRTSLPSDGTVPPIPPDYPEPPRTSGQRAVGVPMQLGSPPAREVKPRLSGSLDGPRTGTPSSASQHSPGSNPPRLSGALPRDVDLRKMPSTPPRTPPLAHAPARHERLSGSLPSRDSEGSSAPRNLPPSFPQRIETPPAADAKKMDIGEAHAPSRLSGSCRSRDSESPSVPRNCAGICLQALHSALKHRLQRMPRRWTSEKHMRHQGFLAHVVPEIPKVQVCQGICLQALHSALKHRLQRMPRRWTLEKHMRHQGFLAHVVPEIPKVQVHQGICLQAVHSALKHRLQRMPRRWTSEKYMRHQGQRHHRRRGRPRHYPKRRRAFLGDRSAWRRAPPTNRTSPVGRRPWRWALGSARSALGACCACGEQPKGVFQPTDEFGGWIKQKQDV